MARSKEFDPDVALREAMQLFWENGYEATSVEMLTQRLGISRASLYSTFGDKRRLYVLALEEYLASRDPDPVELLSQPGPVLPAVRALVERYVEESASDSQRLGCLVVNTATELLPRDRELSKLVESSWNTLEVALTTAMLRARAQGELRSGCDPRAAARFILVFLQGVRVMAKADSSGDRLRDAAAAAWSLIEP